MPNIGFVHGRYPFGGGEKVTSHIAPYLKDLGYRVFVFSSRIHHAEISAEDKQNITFVDVGKTRLFSSPKVKLSDKVQQLGIDILVFVGKAFSASMEGIFSKTSCKCIFAHHGMTFWQAENYGEELRMKASKSPLHWLYYSGILATKHLIHRKIKIEKYRLIYNKYHAFVTLCDAYRDELLQALEASHNTKIISISPPILPLSAPLSLHKKKQVIYVGRMSFADKRADRLIDIWREVSPHFPDWELVLLGDGKELPVLKEKAHSYGLSRIRFMGEVKNVEQYYRTASILCLTSQVEGLGMVLAEAQQSGVVPMAFACSAGVRALLSPNGENGILVTPYDMKEYASKLSDLMQNDALRNQIQANIIKKTVPTPKAVAQMWHELFEKVLQGKDIC